MAIRRCWLEGEMTSSSNVLQVSQIWEQLVIEAKDLRRKQDARLVVHQQRSAFLFVGFLAIGTIAGSVFAAPAAGVTGAQLVTAAVNIIAIASVNGVIWYLVHLLPNQWHEAPDVDLLVQNFSNRHNGYQALQRNLVETLMDHFHRNESLIRRVRIWIGVQAAVNMAFIYLAIVILATLGLGS